MNENLVSSCSPPPPPRGRAPGGGGGGARGGGGAGGCAPQITPAPDFPASFTQTLSYAKGLGFEVTPMRLYGKRKRLGLFFYR